MKDSTHIYERIILTKYYNMLRNLRDVHNQFKEGYGSQRMGQETVVDLFGDDSNTYGFIMKQSNNYLYDMISEVILHLVGFYCKNIDCIGIHCSDAYVYIDSKIENRLLGTPSLMHDKRRIHMYAEHDKSGGTLYIIKQFGPAYKVPRNIVTDVKRRMHVWNDCYVSIVEDAAFFAYMNHNDDLTDESRGTNDYSLRWFFNKLFPAGEYDKFKYYLSELEKRMKDYNGLTIVKSLNSHAMHSFRAEVGERLKNIDIDLLDKDKRISASQRDLLMKYYVEKGAYRMLIGNSEFSNCFLTAEWMFSTLLNSPNVDLTSTIFGYYKAIEQFLYAFLLNHTYERDHKYRKIRAGKQGLVILEDSLMRNPEEANKLSLRELASVLGYYNNDQNKPIYEYRNRDLLNSGISMETYKILLEKLSAATTIRNTFFHKNNVDTWERAKEYRALALFVFFLLLGAYRYSEKDMDELGLTNIGIRDEYSKLCDYMEMSLADATNTLGNRVFPVYYLNSDKSPLMYQRALDVSYNVYFEPIYPEIKFKIIPPQFDPQKKYGPITREKASVTVVIQRDKLPEVIWRGNAILTREKPGWEFSGPLEKVFERGRFVAGKENTNKGFYVE